MPQRSVLEKNKPIEAPAGGPLAADDPPDAGNTLQLSAQELAILAQKVYQLLRQQLRQERERLG